MNKSGNKSKRIAFVLFYGGYVDRSPSIINFINSLSKDGYILDIFSINSIQNIFDPDDKNINFYCKSDIMNNRSHIDIIQSLDLKLFRCLSIKLRRSVSKHGIKTCFFYVLFILRYLNHLSYFSYMLYVTKKNNCMCFIGIEKLGLIVADLTNCNNIPQIYYSLELYYSSPPGIRGLAFNVTRELEKAAHNNSQSTIVQDEERGNILFGYNDIDKDKQDILYLPVSVLGDSFKERTNYFYETLGIPRDKKIFLQLGMIASLRMSAEIAESAQNWPDDWVLVMHGNFYEGIEQQISNLNKKGNIYISKEKLPFEDIPKVVASAHIGLVFYRVLEDSNYFNNFYIGYSSGQLAHHLQCGIPIIAFNIPSLKKVVDESQCGLIVNNTESIEESAKMILSNYKYFRENAFKCFEERYRFEKHFKDVSKYIDSI